MKDPYSTGREAEAMGRAAMGEMVVFFDEKAFKRGMLGRFGWRMRLSKFLIFLAVRVMGANFVPHAIPRDRELKPDDLN